MWRVVFATCLLACGATPRGVTPPPVAHEEAPEPFASRDTLTLRSPSVDAGTSFSAERAQDGTIHGARCGATRFTDEGVLARDEAVIARVVREGEVFAVLAADDRDTRWRIEDGVLSASGEARFRVMDGQIVSSDPLLPAIAIDPPSTSPHVALGFFAALLACDGAP